MKNEEASDSLNILIEINNDRIDGYETAKKENEENDLRNLFNQLSQTSRLCNEELISEVKRLGGTPITGTTTSGKLYRAWMDIRVALTGKERVAILKSCEYGEDVAVHTYEKVMREAHEIFTIEQRRLVEDQYYRIKSDHDSVKALRDTAVEVQ